MDNLVRVFIRKPHRLFTPYLILIFCILLGGCAVGTRTGYNILPLPSPSVDDPIRSVQHYNLKYNVDLLAQNHNISEEIDAENRTSRNLEHYFHKVTIGGKSVIKFPPNIEYLKKSRRLGGNDYVVECVGLPPLDKQADSDLCWAACVQYMSETCLGIKIDQQKIAAERKRQHGGDINSPGTVSDIMAALGYFQIHVTTDGSLHILRALGHNLPVMVGLKPGKEGEPGHAMIIIGARYSFASKVIPLITSYGNVAFNEFAVMDPRDGSVTRKPATEFENRTDFILTFYDQKFRN